MPKYLINGDQYTPDGKPCAVNGRVLYYLVCTFYTVGELHNFLILWIVYGERCNVSVRSSICARSVFSVKNSLAADH